MSSSSQVAMDEEAQKRNTDCVYFLASPLTCKKGNSCEFRHSEAARMNPRDCWYWIHSTCRNPNCSFRHPPLEGKPASSVPPQSAAPTPVASTSSMPAAALASKSKTPCYFFSQGNCAKGDKCPFMHGPALPTTDASTQQKPPKAPQGESGQVSNKPVVVLKSFTPNVIKPTPCEYVEKWPLVQNDSRPGSSKAPLLSAHEKPQIAKDSEKAKVLGSSVTTNPYRTEKVPGGRKSRVTLFSDTPDEFLNASDRPQDRPQSVHPVVEKRQGHPARKQQQSHYEHEHSHSLQGADHRYQNGSKGDAWWKNDSSSLDCDGSDQSIQREDGEYSPRFGGRGRPKVSDDSTSHAFKGPQSHGRDEFDTIPAQHRQAGYLQHREQQMQHESDYNGTADHSRHYGFPTGTRTSSRDGQRKVSEGYTSSVDLRDHLMKRRRDDRGHQPRSESLSRRAPSDMVDTHINQRRDDGFTQKDHGRVPLRGVDHRGIKRLRHDGGASPDGRPPSRISPIRRLGPGRSPDRALSVVSPNRHPVADHSRNERERGRDRYASKTALAGDVRRISASSRIMKSEYAKDNTAFSGPKSLAQIKAEKEAEAIASVTQGRGQRGKPLEENMKLADSTSSMQANHQDSITSSSRLKRLHADSSLSSKRESKLATSEEFEGPKPLSELLKEKHKVELDSNVEVGMAALKKTEDVLSDSNREMEDGEVRDEEEDWKDDHSHDTDSPILPPQEETIPRSEFDPNMEEPLEADHSQGVADDLDDMESPDDEMRLEIGQTMSGDEDYELDDEDDDDFAKKLGGFFS